MQKKLIIIYLCAFFCACNDYSQQEIMALYELDKNYLLAQLTIERENKEAFQAAANTLYYPQHEQRRNVFFKAFDLIVSVEKELKTFVRDSLITLKIDETGNKNGQRDEGDFYTYKEAKYPLGGSCYVFLSDSAYTHFEQKIKGYRNILVGAYRSVAAPKNAQKRDSLVDELAKLPLLKDMCFAPNEHLPLAAFMACCNKVTTEFSMMASIAIDAITSEISGEESAVFVSYPFIHFDTKKYSTIKKGQNVTMNVGVADVLSNLGDSAAVVVNGKEFPVNKQGYALYQKENLKAGKYKIKLQGKRLGGTAGAYFYLMESHFSLEVIPKK